MYICLGVGVFIIQIFLGTTMKIRRLLVLCYPRHLAFAFNY